MTTADKKIIRGSITTKKQLLTSHLDMNHSSFSQRANALSDWEGRAHNVMKHAHSTAAHKIDLIKSRSSKKENTDSSDNAIQAFFKNIKKEGCDDLEMDVSGP